jgi:hypothetical protein
MITLVACVTVRAIVTTPEKVAVVRSGSSRNS